MKILSYTCTFFCQYLLFLYPHNACASPVIVLVKPLLPSTFANTPTALPPRDLGHGALLRRETNLTSQSSILQSLAPRRRYLEHDNYDAYRIPVQDSFDNTKNSVNQVLYLTYQATK